MKGVLSLNQVSKTIEDKFTLGPLDLQIEPGFIVAVVGLMVRGKPPYFGC